MGTRLDRLILLLETGSNPQIKATAAKQLGEIAKRSFATSSSVEAGEGKVKVDLELGVGLESDGEWSEVLSLVGRILPHLRSKSYDTRSAASLALAEISRSVPTWSPPTTLSLDFDLSSVPQPCPPIDIDLATLLLPSHPKLLASSGKEFAAPAVPTTKEEIEEGKREVMKRLGISSGPGGAGGGVGGLDLGFGDLVKDELDDSATSSLPPSAVSSAQPSPSLPTSSLPSLDSSRAQSPSTANGSSSGGAGAKGKGKDKVLSKAAQKKLEKEKLEEEKKKEMEEYAGLSARQINALKRKRKMGGGGPAPVPATKPRLDSLPSPATSSAPSPSQPYTSSSSSNPNPLSEAVVIDPGAKATANAAAAATAAASGGAVSEGGSADLGRGLIVERDASGRERWPWERVVEVLSVSLFSASWEIRHGAAMGLRDIIKTQGSGLGRVVGYPPSLNSAHNAAALLSLAHSLLSLLALDRFGDYNADQVVAPVRETAAQTLASVMMHMGEEEVRSVHGVLVRMVNQEASRSAEGGTKGVKEKGYAWEVRHAGLLGLKYEVAVRGDLVGRKDDSGVGKAVKEEPIEMVKLEVKEEVKPEGSVGLGATVNQSGIGGLAENDARKSAMLKDVVDAAVLGLADSDDDVRSVSAACLLPVSSYLVNHLPDELARVVTVLWDAMSEGGDELGSSTGGVMDLLGTLIKYPQCISLMTSSSSSSPSALSLPSLVPRLYPFFRHTIPAVRLAVPSALLLFLTVPSLPTSWIDARLFRFLLQNIVLEDRADIRDASLRTWKAAMNRVSESGDKDKVEKMWDEEVLPFVAEWMMIAMSPPGVALDANLFLKAHVSSVKVGKTGRSGESLAVSYNVDKNAMAQDLSLISVNVVLKGRFAAAEALALLMIYGSSTNFQAFFVQQLFTYLASTAAHQILLASIIIEEWSKAVDESPASQAPAPLPLVNEHAKLLVNQLIVMLEGQTPPTYYEMLLVLSQAFTDCHALLATFVTDAKIPQTDLPSIPSSLDPAAVPADLFTVDVAGSIAGDTFEKLAAKLTRPAQKKLLPLLREKQMKIISSIGFYMSLKEKYDRQVSAALAAAVIALRTMPAKLNPVIRSIMNGVKYEENLDLQTRFAQGVSSFIAFSSSPLAKTNPSDKIIKNLSTFVCQDVTQTPIFANNSAIFDGILSLREQEKATAAANAAAGKGKEAPVVESDEVVQARITTRGAKLALGELAKRFGPAVFREVPKLWSCMAAPLTEVFPSGIEAADIKMASSPQFGQDVLDCLTVLSIVTSQVDSSLHHQIAALFPLLVAAIQSRFAVVRRSAARAIAVVCDVATVEGMRDVVQMVLPLLGDPTTSRRQGAVEVVSHIVKTLDTKALPYVLFMIVPVLGRMSDPDDDVRHLATSTFASLVKTVPLEAGIPDPPGFSEEMLAKRAGERQFLNQLLDGSKVEEYVIPVEIKAELRKYQRDGVSWLAFLAKYQLHGILCDDMGLGKSLQSLTILASKHHERAERFKQTASPDSVHLPSIIVCPPTLTGHWYHEILKFTPNLKPLLYVGPSQDRPTLLPQIAKHDVVIMSYDIVRNDIAKLGTINWNYCILDEGHIIKNGKTKLTKAVKLLRANHRLILSGTPIQNNVLELWSLFDFLMPGFLGSERSFNERFGKPITITRDGKASAKEREAAALALEALHKQVLPFLLRRLKEDVLADLPPKIIQDYYCDLSDVQKQLYDTFSRSSAIEQVGNAVSSSSSGGAGGRGGEKTHVFQSLQYLRKLCNHPCLVAKEEDYPAIQGAIQRSGGTGGETLRDLVNAPKLLALKQILLDCGIGHAEPASSGPSSTAPSEADTLSLSTTPQHRVLIFCQLKTMLDIIQTDLFARHLPSLTYMRLDGSTDPSKRHGVVQTFNSDPSIDVLLLTTQVGGLGLNLTGADTVIFVEHDWNPMKDLQAMDRAHRLGQKKVVNVYRLITKGTLEEKIMGLQRFKLNIASSIVTQQNNSLDSMNTSEVLDLFKISTGEEDAAAQAAKRRAAVESGGPVSQKSLLEGLEDMPNEDEYEGLGMDSFLNGLG